MLLGIWLRCSTLIVMTSSEAKLLVQCQRCRTNSAYGRWWEARIVWWAHMLACRPARVMVSLASHCSLGFVPRPISAWLATKAIPHFLQGPAAEHHPQPRPHCKLLSDLHASASLNAGLQSQPCCDPDQLLDFASVSASSPEAGVHTAASNIEHEHVACCELC